MWRAWLRYRSAAGARRTSNVVTGNGRSVAVLEQRGQIGEHPLDVIGPGLEQVEGAVAHTAVFRGDLTGVADVGLTHLEEDPTGDDQTQRGVDEITGQRVQHHIYAATTGRGTELVLELQRAGVTDVVVVKAHRPQRVPLALAGGGKDLQPEVPRQLYRGHADPAGGGMDQDALARLDIGQRGQRVVGRREDHRRGRRFGVGPPRRYVHQQTRVGDRHRAGALGEQSGHPVTDRETADTRGGFDHDTGRLHAHDGVFVGVQAERDHDVAEVGRHGANRDPYLTGFQRRVGVRDRFEHQVFERALAGHAQAPRVAARRHQQRVHRPAAVHPARVHRVIAHQDLRLTGRQYRGDRRITQCRIGIRQDDPARVLGLRRTHQPPDRGTGQIGDVLPRPCDRTSRRHHQRSGIVLGEPRLQRGQCFVGATVGRAQRIVVGGLRFEHVVRRCLGG